MADAAPIILTDGSQSFDGGVDSNKVTSLRSELNPYGLARNELAWLVNGTVRDGAVCTRNGWHYRATTASASSGYLFQGGAIYEPINASPCIIVLISGVLYKVLLEAPYTVTDLTGGNAALRMPATEPYGYFCQAEDWMIVQAGDYVTLPLFYDNVTLRRSKGITAVVAPGDVTDKNEIAAGGPMVYYQGRVWWASGRTVNGGDIVGSTSGINTPDHRDSVLKVTENPLVVGGDGFTVPTNAGNIRALKYSANLDTTLGQSSLYVMTRKQIYALDVPIERADWIAADTQNQPTMRVVQFVNGPVNDRSVAAANGDLFYQSLEPSIRSLVAAIRYYGQWGNTPIAANEDRILKYNNRGLLHYATGAEFDNRMLQSALPVQTAYGVVHQALIPLDFLPVASFNKEHPPVWEGHLEGLDHFQIFSVDYNGLARCFTFARSRLNDDMQLWEITSNEQFDYTATEDNRITLVAETPAYTFDMPHKLKQLKGGEIWLDQLWGTVDIKVYYRQDADPCWRLWYVTKLCVARNSAEDVSHPEVYPEEPYSPGYKWPIVLPAPPHTCDSMHVRPTDVGYQFQVKIEMTGWARIRTVLIYGVERPKSIYRGLREQDTPADAQAMNVT